MKSLAVSQTAAVQGHSNTQRRFINSGIKLSLPLASLAVAIASANYAPEVKAQSGGVQEMRFLEEIVVTARRREESSQDIPIAVSAMNSEFLREQNITELNDLGTQVPSLRVSTGGTSTNEPVLSIRGQRPTDSTLGLDAAIPIYFADVVMTPVSGTNLAMYDLENVQVLKGPQGTLFGRNSTGGALLLSPAKPGVEFGGYLEADAGDFGKMGLEGAVDLPVNDVLQFRLAGRMLKRDGYQDNVADNALNGDEKFWDEDSRSVRLTTNVTLENFNNLLMVGYDENKANARVPVPVAFNSSTQLGSRVNSVFNSMGEVDSALARQARRDVDQVESDVDAPDEIKNLIVSNISEFELTDNLTLKNILGYRKMEWHRTNDADGTALPLFGARTSTTGNVTLNPPMLETESEQYSEEIQLLGTAFDDRLDWLVGAYWYEMKGSQDGIIQVMGFYPENPFLSIEQTAPNGDIVNEAYALFAEGTYTFNEQWALTVGLRQSWDKREMTARNFFGLNGNMNCVVQDENLTVLPNDACSRTVNEDYSSPTGRIALSYTPLDDMMFYGSISTGYRAGGFNLRAEADASFQPFDEEQVITYEVGQKTDWYLMNVPMRTNLAVYMQKYEDIQKTQSVSTGASGFGTATVNAAKATIKGIELDVTAAVTENLTLNLAYSYVDAGYDEWDSMQTWGGVGYEVDLSDSEFVYMPEQSLTASVNYTLPVDQSLGEMSLMASVYWQSEMITDETSIVYAQQAAVENWAADDLATAQRVSEVDGYSVVNVRFDWRNVMGSNFDVAAFVNNASDEEYVVGGLNVIDSLGWTAFTYGAPRTVGASLRYQF